MKKPRVVVAGQVPPPLGGQAIFIQRELDQLRAEPGFETVHWAFYFTRDARAARRAGVGKAVELVRAIGRLLRIRAAGPVDCLLYPAGGPQTVPIIRDLLLLPWALLCARHVVLHFHAAGIADRLRARRGLTYRALAVLYRRVAGAVVMTPFNRRDPEFFGIRRVTVLPHRVPDAFRADWLDARPPADRAPVRLLCVGHLCPDKGTPALVEAFGRLLRRQPPGEELTLDLVGECLAPYRPEDLRAAIAAAGAESAVRLRGPLTGDEKERAFAGASLFVFASVAPYESFGLVLTEAMMWALPVVATDWRGNRDVLGEDFGGVCAVPGDDLAGALTAALGQALAQRSAWTEWGARNRRTFTARYAQHPAQPGDYVELVRGALADVGARQPAAPSPQ